MADEVKAKSDKKKEEFSVVHPRAAGIDIGSTSLWVSAGVEQKVRKFGTFTEDIVDLVNYLKEHQADTVAMEATGSYWIVLYEMIEAAGIDVWLVNGAHVKNVPGRKSDLNDCQWLQYLHRCGLLRKSFVPTDEIRVLRTFRRLREDNIAQASGAVQLMQKAFISMNIQVHNVISQLKGVSGLRIIDAILAGERNPSKLADLCAAQILDTKRDAVEKSLVGTWNLEHLFALRQARQTYQFYQDQIAACDKQMDQQLQKIGAAKAPVHREGKTKPIRHNRPKIPELGDKLLRLTEGKDATAISGMTDKTFLELISEIGLDMSRWPTAKHFTSWLGLAPKQNQSGQRRRNLRHHTNRAGQIFRLSAQALGQSKDLALGGFYRRKKAQKCPGIAVMATARKLAQMYYNVMRYGKDFVEKGLKDWEKQQLERARKRLQHLAEEAGYILTPKPMTYAIRTK